MSNHKIVEFPKGSTVWVQNSVNPGFFYILKDGKIAIKSDIAFQDKNLNHYYKGDSFGLVSGLTGNPNRNTLIAEEDCTVVMIPLSHLGRFYKHNRKVCVKIIAHYSNQLRCLDNHLMLSTQNNFFNTTPESLVQNAFVYVDLGKKDFASHALQKFLSWAEKQEVNSNLKRLIIEAENLLKTIALNYKPPVYSANLLKLKKGEIIFAENEPNDYFYVIKKGRIKIFKLVKREEFILSVLEDGEIFGEMAVLNQEVRNASAVAFEDSEILRLQSSSFLDDIGEALLHKLFEVFARRIWYAYQRVLILQLNDPNAKLYGYIQILISDYNAKKHKDQREYIFPFTLTDLKKMIGKSLLPDKEINDFLTDSNIDLSHHTLRVLDRRKIDDKVALHQNRQRKGNTSRIYI